MDPDLLASYRPIVLDLHYFQMIIYQGTAGGWSISYCKFGNFCEGFIFAKLSICEVS